MFMLRLSDLSDRILFEKGAERPGTGSGAGMNDKSRFRRTYAWPGVPSRALSCNSIMTL